MGELEELLRQFPEQAKANLLTTPGITGHVEVTRCLLSFRADVNQKNPYGMTALTIAVCRGFTRIVAELLAARADPHMRDPVSKLTAMDVAKLRGANDECASLLLAPRLP